MAKLLTEPVPHDEGRALIEGKVAVTRAVFDRMLPELQARAFMVTGVESANVLQRVRDLTAQLPVGGDFDELKGKILDEISPWLVTDMDPEEAAKQLAEARRRAELLLRMHGWQAYAQTQHEELMEMTDVFPYSQYISSEDNRVRPTHAALNRKIFPTDHPFWHNHTGPWEIGCRCDKVGMMEDEVDEARAAEADKPIEDRIVVEGPMLEEVERGNLVLPNGTGKLDIRTPREKKGSSGYEWRPGDRGLDMDAILQRYDPTVRADFTAWAQGEKLEDGRTVWESFGGKPDSSEPPLPRQAPVVPPAPATPRIPKKKPRAITPPAAVLPEPGPVPAVVPPRQSPVSVALDLGSRPKPELKHILDVIDDLHDDGKLPMIPVTGKVSRTANGHYCHISFTGTAVNIGVKASGPHPGLTFAHELGHFLDHHGMGQPGVFQSTVPGSRVAAIVSQLRGTPTYQRIEQEAGNIASVAYYQSAKELWARAYAQYVAEESADARLMQQLDAIRNGFAPWRQWSAVEFAPIRDSMRKHFADLGWNPKPPSIP